MSLTDDVGARLKQQRKAAQLTLQEVADLTGLTASFLSQVERGKVNLSLNSLQNIARALNIPVLHLLADTTVPEANHTTNDSQQRRISPVVRHQMRPRLSLPETGLELELMVNHLGKKMVAYKEHLQPGTEHIATRLREPTEEIFYVLAGTIDLVLTYGEYRLEADDSIYFDGEDLIRIVNPSTDEEAVWVGVITPPVY
jgi:transcriptional regulator with XRE-family HTH domain